MLKHHDASATLPSHVQVHSTCKHYTQEHAHQLETELRTERAARRTAEAHAASLREQLAAKKQRRAVKFGPRSWLSRRPTRRPALDSIDEEGSVASQSSLQRDLDSFGRATGSVAVAGGGQPESPAALRRLPSGALGNGGALGLQQRRGASCRSVLITACMLAALVLLTVMVVVLRERARPEVQLPGIEGEVLAVHERGMDVAMRMAAPGDVRYVVVRGVGEGGAGSIPTAEDVFWVAAGRRYGDWGEVGSYCAILKPLCSSVWLCSPARVRISTCSFVK